MWFQLKILIWEKWKKKSKNGRELGEFRLTGHLGAWWEYLVVELVAVIWKLGDIRNHNILTLGVITGDEKKYCNNCSSLTHNRSQVLPGPKKRSFRKSKLFVNLLVCQFHKVWFLNHLPGSGGENCFFNIAMAKNHLRVAVGGFWGDFPQLWTEMEKAADASDMSVLFFSAGADF